MCLTEIKSVSQTRDTAELETKVSQLERMINAIAAIDPDIVEKAKAFVSARLETWRLENQLMKPLGEMSPISGGGAGARAP